MAKSKYVNIPLSCLPETLTMPRPKKDVCNEALYEIGVDKAIEGMDRAAIFLVNIDALRQEIAEALFLPPEFFQRYGAIPSQRPARQHVDSTIVKPKQLT